LPRGAGILGRKRCRGRVAAPGRRPARLPSRLHRAGVSGHPGAGGAAAAAWPLGLIAGGTMAHQGKHSNKGPHIPSTGSAPVRRPDQNQLDFELEFFGRILERYAEYVDVLRVQGNNLTLKGRYAEGMQIDKRLVQLRPNDPLAHYNLACSYALLKRPDQA